MSPSDLSQALQQIGRASIPYLDPFSPDRPLVLESYRPPRYDPDKPVVIVQHGASRINDIWPFHPFICTPAP